MKIFIFRRDLRIEDNTTLNEAIKDNKEIALVFIFNDAINKEYFANKGQEYLNKRLGILNKQVPINFYRSKDDIEVLKEINKSNKIEGVYFNSDITEFANKRDLRIQEYCKSNNIDVVSYNDYLLFNPKDTVTKSGTSFKTFKSFFESKLKLLNNIKSNNIKYSNDLFIKLQDNKYSSNLEEGKDYGMKINRKEVFESIDRVTAIDYKNLRDYFAFENSKISAALKFGVVSCREAIEYCYSKKEINLPFVRQVLWKEFYHQYYVQNKNEYKIRGEYPTNILTKYNEWVFNDDLKLVQLWKEGKTGFPIIDAAMHELNTTGYMHNRARMIVASFFCKNLNLDWRIGEKYFATKLIDYDPIVNNQSWQWASFTGLDYQGAYRTFSPSIQLKKFDPDLEYVNKYNKDNEIKPIVDEKESRKEFMELIKEYNK
ncbi:MAG: deoxyribodipyrimidine photo-lyase [Mycoplasma sp.]|nr:deoxyribodipyrimidine photo-lyase [Mycoplasma sp.]